METINWPYYECHHRQVLYCTQCCAVYRVYVCTGVAGTFTKLFTSDIARVDVDVMFTN